MRIIGNGLLTTVCADKPMAWEPEFDIVSTEKSTPTLLERSREFGLIFV